MFAWILVLALWVAPLSLILHDATKDDGDGSVISIAAKSLVAFLHWATLKAAEARRALSYSLSQMSVSKPAINIVSKPATKIETAVGTGSLSSEPICQGAPPVQAPAAPPPKKWWRKEWRKDRRVSITIPELELAIAEAVKQAAPGCEAFVGVIVQQTTPKMRFDANWALRGVKFGKADRETVNEALPTIVERMQREFRLSEQ
jgi:hypothetical protein